MDNIDINTRTILRKINNQFFLINPDLKKIFLLNDSGKKLWQSLISGLSLEALYKQIPEEKYIAPLNDFLFALHKNHFIALPQELCSQIHPDIAHIESSSETETIFNEKIVRGNSMLRTLLPGELLITRQESFNNLGIGDIILFRNKEITVHRIIKRNPDKSFITIGDNNDSPDPGSVNEENYIALVIAKITEKGKKIAVSRGRTGMNKYYFNRFRRFFRKAAGKAFNAMLFLAFWRKTPDRSCKFDSITQYYCGKKVVMWQIAGNFTYPNWKYKLLYRNPEQSFDQ